jgi:hypothetical protein
MSTDTYVPNAVDAAAALPGLEDLDAELPVTGRGLTIPRLRVLPADGEPWEVQAYNPDLMLYERTAAQHRWPPIKSAPFTWMTFLAWAASRRTGRIPETLSWEVFAATVLEVTDAGAVAADPTPPGPDPG